MKEINLGHVVRICVGVMIGVGLSSILSPTSDRDKLLGINKKCMARASVNYGIIGSQNTYQKLVPELADKCKEIFISSMNALNRSEDE